CKGVTLGRLMVESIPRNRVTLREYLMKIALSATIPMNRNTTRSRNMLTIIKKLKLVPCVMLITCICLLFVSGCARYARNVNTLYEPSANVRGGSGEVYIIIPENRQTHSSDIKWVLGQVKDDDNNNIDEVF